MSNTETLSDKIVQIGTKIDEAIANAKEMERRLITLRVRFSKGTISRDAMLDELSRLTEMIKVER